MTNFRNAVKLVASPLDASLRAELIANLLVKYAQRIGSKLAGRFPVNLRILPSHTGTSDEGKTNFITLRDEEVGREIGEIFDQAKGRLLVVGLPGAGKTTLLLQLAVALLRRAERVAHLEGVPHVTPALPVLLNLATWRTEFGTFDEWLRRILPNELGTSKALAEKIRSTSPLILLLDGLDEVPETDRNSCLVALGQYGIKPENQYVVSTRIAEYAAAKDAPVYAQIEVAPLTAEQIEMSLTAYAGLTPEAKPLLNAIQKDPLLKQAIENPFYLNTAQLLFASGKNWSEFGFAAGDVAGRQRELVGRFVEYALGHKVKRAYPAEKAKKWLGFLAGKMEEEGLRVFELVDLGPRWAKLSSQVPIFIALGGPVLFLIGIAVWELAFFIFYHQTSNESLNLMLIGIAMAVVFNVNNSLIRSGLKGREIVRWSWISFKGNWLSKFLSVFNLHYFVATVFCAIFWIVLMLFSSKGFSINLFFTSVGVGVRFGLPFGILSGIFAAVKSGFYFENILKITTPYQRFFHSLRNFEYSILAQIAIRFSLYVEGKLPLRLVHFLNEMSRRHLLEFDGDLDTETGGGTWWWRHRILQEYFLNKDQP